MEKSNLDIVKAALGYFKIDGEISEIAPFGNGHINDTFKIATSSGKSYVLQTINRSIFKKPDEVM